MIVRCNVIMREIKIDEFESRRTISAAIKLVLGLPLDEDDDETPDRSRSTTTSAEVDPETDGAGPGRFIWPLMGRWPHRLTW